VIPVDHIVNKLRGAVDGSVSVKCVGPTWNEVYAGNVAFWFDDWKIEIFNDCDSFDYIDLVEAPDGRQARFEDWWEGKEIPDCPESRLSQPEVSRLTEILEGATP
jgi:hypothetical protein